MFVTLKSKHNTEEVYCISLIFFGEQIKHATAKCKVAAIYFHEELEGSFILPTWRYNTDAKL